MCGAMPEEEDKGHIIAFKIATLPFPHNLFMLTPYRGCDEAPGERRSIQQNEVLMPFENALCAPANNKHSFTSSYSLMTKPRRELWNGLNAFPPE